MRLGVLRHAARFPTIKIAYAESQVGWMPFLLERMDVVWHEDVAAASTSPSRRQRTCAGRVFGCIFDDQHGLNSRDEVGLEHILFETDYPHADGTWPEHARRRAPLVPRGCDDAGRVRALVRGNAIGCYGLERFGIAA